MSTAPTDPAMTRAAQIFEKSGKTLDGLGLEMGYEPGIARKAAWQFLNKTGDPRLSMLRRFAKAMQIRIDDLVTDEAERPGKTRKK